METPVTSNGFSMEARRAISSAVSMASHSALNLLSFIMQKGKTRRGTMLFTQHNPLLKCQMAGESK
jgi:hypothetical protein